MQVWHPLAKAESLLPSLSIYIRQANYARLRKTAEKNGKTIGQIINKLVEANL
jgi:hypothetical protein